MPATKGIRALLCGALVAALIISGCQSGAAPANDVTNLRLPKSRLSWSDFECSFYSADEHRVIHVVLAYDSELAGIDSNHLIKLTEQLTVDEELLLLSIYIRDSAYHYLNGEQLSPGVTIERISPPSSAGRWFLSDTPLEYSPETLQWREAGGGKLYKIVPAVGKSESTHWEPLTSSSYQEWWNLVDQRYDVVRKFSSHNDRLRP